jgi:alpha-methylacyl-CoA racemase
MTAPLAGLRIVEFASIGPGPFAGMMFADHGAEVIRIERPGPPSSNREVLHRSRRSLVVDLKRAEGIEVVKALTCRADGVIEGLRPGVMERLGLGPDALLAENPRLVYGRMTGWGQSGPLARAAGHDLNYIALSGALHGMGRSGEAPPPPLNLVGDFGGGAMMLAFGMLAAMFAARAHGRGQVVDAAITDGSALLMAMFHSAGGTMNWNGPRGTNPLGGAAPFYDTYETADGLHVALAAIEPQFFADFLCRVGLQNDAAFAAQMDTATWRAAKTRLAALFKTRTRADWCAMLEGTDVCFAPVLSLAEAPGHPHNAARGTFLEAFGITQPAPAPRYSESAAVTPTLVPAGTDTETLLAEAGFTPARIAQLLADGVVAGPGRAA